MQLMKWWRRNPVSYTHLDVYKRQAQIPDLVPILCMAAAAAEGKTEIRNAGRLRIKESDRLTAMADCLKRLGVPVEEKQDGLVIHGGTLTEQQGAVSYTHLDVYKRQRASCADSL